MRVGFGFDLHPLVGGRRLVLGGVEIPYDKGLVGHSDADIVLHAIGDAMLGAVGLGDLGTYFPDTDPSLKDIESKKIVKKIKELTLEKGYRCKNVDVTIVAQKPRLFPYIEEMRDNISELLDIEKSFVNLKATTTEGLGIIGKEEAMAAFAVVLMEHRYGNKNL